MYDETLQQSISRRSTTEHRIFQREEVVEVSESSAMDEDEVEVEILTLSQYQLRLPSLFGEMSKRSNVKWLFTVLNQLLLARLEVN